jgi:hypothetical protein
VCLKRVWGKRCRMWWRPSKLSGHATAATTVVTTSMTNCAASASASRHAHTHSLCCPALPAPSTHRTACSAPAGSPGREQGSCCPDRQGCPDERTCGWVGGG